MQDDGFWDFMIGGGDELLNTQECPHCGQIIYLDQEIKWVDSEQGIARCPYCGGKVEIE
jgi:DNA-directed RNA polymerase subunit RPC12/RpoP